MSTIVREDRQPQIHRNAIIHKIYLYSCISHTTTDETDFMEI